MTDAVQIIFPPAPLGVQNAIDTVAELRALDSTNVDANTEVLVAAQGFYKFDPSSLATDDGATVIKPDDLTTLQAGRWLVVLLASADLVSFEPSGTGAVARTVQDKLREVSVSVTDYGGVSSTSIDNTAAFAAAIAALGTNGGIVDVPMGTWRVNLIIDHVNITLRGVGGDGQDETRPCIRPYNTGAGTTTLKIGNQTGYRFRNKLENLVISGDRGDGTMADKALWLAGGCIFFSARDVDLRDGLHSLHVEPGGTYAATGMKLEKFFIRNDVNDALARAVYVRKYADATGYVTDFHLNMSKVNKTGAGYWLEVDGTGSVGLVVHFNSTYVDHGSGMGILCSASGLETIECFGGLQLDPGGAGTVIMKRGDLVKDPSRYLRGEIEGVGGQMIQFSDASTLTFPDEPGAISFESLLRRAFFCEIIYLTQPSSPYATSVYLDFASDTGPLRWNGIKHRWTDTTDATSASTGAMGTSGGFSAAKAIYAGLGVHSDVGFYFGATQVVASRQAAVTAPTGGGTVDSQARTAINDLIARLQAHGLIS